MRIQIQRFYLMFNAGLNSADFILPTIPMGHGWYLAADTSHILLQEMQMINTKNYVLQNRSSAILLARKKENT